MLYLVPSPIGNLDDMSFRAVKILQEVDRVLAEDTRVSSKLLKHFGIDKSIDSFHAHNEHKKLDFVINELKNGTDIALLSDAGTPGISDPGFLLVRKAVEEGIQVSCLPGATALIPALVMSGLPCDKFYFEGFLPHKKGRMSRIQFLLSLEYTFVMYESPYRVIKTLEQINDQGGGDRRMSLSREISKLYEENIYGTVSEVLEQLKSRSQLKGEFVLCIEGHKK